MKALLLGGTLLALGTGCGGPLICTTDYRYGVVVTVTDAATGTPRCDASVTISEGAYRETPTPLQVIGSDGGMQCDYAGAGERAGTYAIEVKAENRAKTITDIVVTKGPCHVTTRAVSISL
jgi:hypothetical protein